MMVQKMSARTDTNKLLSSFTRTLAVGFRPHRRNTILFSHVFLVFHYLFFNIYGILATLIKPEARVPARPPSSSSTQSGHGFFTDSSGLFRTALLGSPSRCFSRRFRVGFQRGFGDALELVFTAARSRFQQSLTRHLRGRSPALFEWQFELPRIVQTRQFTGKSGISAHVISTT